MNASPPPRSAGWLTLLTRRAMASPAVALPSPHCGGGTRLFRCRHRLLGSLCRSDPHRLHVCEFADAVLRELPPETASLHTAKRQTRVGRYHAVHENAARFDSAREPLCALDVAGPEIASQAVSRVV